jgi:hypothetical protein
MSSRQKAGMSGTMRPQTEWEVLEEPRNTSPMASPFGSGWIAPLLLVLSLVYPRVRCRRSRGGAADTVVATDPVSVNADYDNGTSLQRQACARLS